MKKWTIEDSKELYNINGWGTSYFGINTQGDVYVSPCKDGTEIDIREIVDELALRDVTPPVLLRFPDILDNRIVSRRPPAVSSVPPRNTTTRARALSSTPSR